MQPVGTMTNLQHLASVLSKLSDDSTRPWTDYPCIEWDRGITGGSGGYGAVKRKNKDELVHRVSWEITNGLIPDGLMVLHRCDNRPCFRPVHLFLGTALDNNMDMTAKGRARLNLAPRGEKQGSAKLTSSQVLKIRKLYANTDLSQTKIGKIFGVHQYAVFAIIHRKTWAHVI